MGNVTLVRLVQDRISCSHAGDAVADRDAGQVGARKERQVSDVGDTVGDRHVGQAGAVGERLVPDDDDAIGDRDAGQAVWDSGERPLPDGGDRQARDRCWGWSPRLGRSIP